MPVHCEKQGNKYRLVGPSGKVETTPKGTPRDGGGHDTAAKCEVQAAAINEGSK